MGDLRRGWFWFWKLIKPLLNERGTIGDQADDIKDPEIPEDDADDKGADDVKESETEDADKTDESLKESDDEDEDKADPAPVPYARFKEVNDKAKRAGELETKFEQFKRIGPDNYYKLYPDEKPQDYTPAADKGNGKDRQAEDSDTRMFEIEGGKYDGMKFGDVFDRDPRAAYQIDPYYARQLDDKRMESERSAQATQQQLRAESEREISDFSNERSAELYGKGLKDLDAKEQAEISKMIADTLDWSEKTGRALGNLKDAYILKNLDKILAGEKSRAARGLFKTLTSAGAPSIGGSKSKGDNGGYDHLANLDANQVAAEMGRWSDRKQVDFLTKAPKRFREKFPDLPYPDERA